MRDKLQKIKSEIIVELERTKTLKQLADLKNRYFGRRSGAFRQLAKDIKNLAAEQRPLAGKVLNEIKVEVEKIMDELKDQFAQVKPKNKAATVFDATLPGTRPDLGSLHPLTQVRREIERVFCSLGFMILDGPELESEWYNFEALNIPADHPARDMQDTFYVKNQNSNSKIQKKNRLVMRTHTSNVQVRAMEKYGAPLRCVVPGRVYRNEATDARHEHTFHQVEGLMIDENISIGNLKAVTDAVIRAILGENYQTRIRPGFFAFVEPGLEIDLSCKICAGHGCKVCKGSGWVEFMGAGMVHPNVLRAGGIDPQKFSGFAFGFGLERIAMMKYGIDDIRLFHSGDLRFLKQFEL